MALPAALMTMIVPDEPDGGDAGDGEPEASGSLPSGRAASGRRLLIVEDDYLVSLAIADVVGAAGYEVIGQAFTGEEAVEIALSEKPDLVLMDIRLAGEIDGIEAAMELARFGIRVLFVTAHSDPKTRELGAAASPRGWVEKPFSPGQLLKAVDAALA